MDNQKKTDQQFLAEFIDVYSCLPALWDARCTDYCNRAKKKEQYDILIEKYREKYSGAKKDDVVRKINSLRTNFRRELRRIREAENIGGLEDNKPVSTLWYFHNMSFLLSQEASPPSMRVMNVSENMLDVSLTYEESDSNTNEANSFSKESNSLIANSENKNNNRKRKLKNSTEEFIELACQRLFQSQDDFDKLAAAWAVELRKIDPGQQLFVRKAISDILFEGQLGTLHRDSVEINASRGPTLSSSQSIS